MPSSPVASPGPAFPVNPLGYNSEDEALGGAELQIKFYRLMGLRVRRSGGKMSGVFLDKWVSNWSLLLSPSGLWPFWTLYGFQWQEKVLSPVEGTAFPELRAALVGYHSQKAFQSSHFVGLMTAWTAQDSEAQLEKLTEARRFGQLSSLKRAGAGCWWFSAGSDFISSCACPCGKNFWGCTKTRKMKVIKMFKNSNGNRRNRMQEYKSRLN